MSLLVWNEKNKYNAWSLNFEVLYIVRNLSLVLLCIVVTCVLYKFKSMNISVVYISIIFFLSLKIVILHTHIYILIVPWFTSFLGSVSQITHKKGYSN